MAFDDRLQFLLLGMAIGGVLGYLVRLLQEIKKELDDVKDEIEEDIALRTKDDAGFIKRPSMANIALLLVVGLAFWSSIVSQKASNDVTDSQDQIDTAISCMITIQTEALTALNERSTYTKATADANVALQESQAKFFGLLLHQPPYSEARRAEAAQTYFQALQDFLELARKGSNKVAENPFPTVQDLRNCLGDQNEKETQ